MPTPIPGCDCIHCVPTSVTARTSAAIAAIAARVEAARTDELEPRRVAARAAVAAAAREDGVVDAETTCDECGESSNDCSRCDNCELCSTVCECVECARCRCSARVEVVCECCEMCARCCRQYSYCYQCSGCNTRCGGESRCDNCNTCNACCECHHCSNCSSHCDDTDYCDNCNNCESCCECDKHHCELLEAGDKVFHSSNRKQFASNKSKRFISAEIEIAALAGEGVGGAVHNKCRQWKAGIVEDGSLPDTGFEINTAPANGDLFVDQITEICHELKQAGAKVSGECGLHVHVDARDFSYYEIRRLINLYALIEDGLFACVSPSRRQSSYARKCGADYKRTLNDVAYKVYCKGKTKSLVAVAVYGTRDIRNLRKQKYDGARYNALNLHSWFYRGTVECRLHSGTADADKIIQWGKLWAGILDWVYTHTDKDVEQLQSSGASSFGMLLKVAPDASCVHHLEKRKAKFDPAPVG